MNWLIRLAFLASEIVEAIVQGNHPPKLTAQALITRRIDLKCDGAAGFALTPPHRRARLYAIFHLRVTAMISEQIETATGETIVALGCTLF